MEKNIEAANQKLKELVETADKSLEDFINLAAGMNVRLDYSIDSLEGVEKLLLIFSQREQFKFIEADAWLYIGQTICKSLDGHWEVSDDLEYNRDYYSLPVVKGFSKFDDEFCPMVEIENFLKIANAGYFRGVIYGMQNGTYRKL